MTDRALQSERFEVLPRRLETYKISIGNLNWAEVYQANVSVQTQELNVVTAQSSYQANYAEVNQSN